MAGADLRPVFEIAFPAPDGATIDERNVDGIRGSVYALPRKLKAGEVRELRGGFAGVVDGMLKGSDGAAITGSLKPMELNGVPGFNISRAYLHLPAGRHAIKCAAFFLVKDEREFHVTGQAKLDAWDELAPELEAAIMSFTVL